MLNLGDRVDRYVVEAFVGEGGLARVYRVRHENLGGQYALKVLAFRGSRLSKRLVREGRIQARLQHPNIVRVHDAFELDGRGALLMEYVEGPGLDEVLNTKGPFALQEALDIFGQVLAGVGAAHEAGVLHRDLKPGNILLRSQGDRVTAKVTDFGIARVLSAQHAEGDTLQSDVIGTPGYMAPEQASDPTQVDVRADLFSLGAILYGMVTGWPPFALNSLAEVLAATEQGAFPPVRERSPDCPDRVVQVIERCLAPDPDDRFDSCRMVAAALFGEESTEVAAVDLASMRTAIGLAEADSEETQLPRASSSQSEADAGGLPPKTLAEFAAPTPAPLAPVPSAASATPQDDGTETAPRGRGRWVVFAVLVGLGVGVALLTARDEGVALEGAPVAPEGAAAPARVAAEDPQPAGAVSDASQGPDPIPGEAPVVAVARRDAPVAARPPAGTPTEPSPAAAPEDLLVAPQDSRPPPPPGREPNPPQSESGTAEPDTRPTVAGPDGSAAPEPEASPAVAALVAPGGSEAVEDRSDPPTPVAASPSVVGSWSGRLGGRASKLRVIGQEGAEVRAVLEVLQGTAYRTFRMAGTLEGDRLRLRGSAESPWSLDARLVGGALEGDLTAPGRKKATSWRATRD